MRSQLSQLLDEMEISEELRTRFEALHAKRRPADESGLDDDSGSSIGALGRYRDLGELGRGGMAVVRRVREPELNRRLAMKIIDPTLLSRDGALARFVNEAQTLSQLQHPNIVPVHELGKLDDGRYYFTMKEVKGRPLSEIIQHVHATADDQANEHIGQTWNLRRLMDVFTRICAAMAFAHSRGVIHRDLKPENILIGEFDQVLVVDWGIAKIMGHEDASIDEPVQITEQKAYQTRMGAIAGTPAYMAPEQARGRIDQIDARTDIYALGAILYEMLSGRSPYGGNSHEQILSRVLGGPPPSVRQSVLQTVRVTETIEFDLFSGLDEIDEEPKVAEPNENPVPLPDELVTACEKSMHRIRERRYSDVEELRTAVQDWIDGIRKREEALAVVEEASSSDPERERLQNEANRLENQAAEKSKHLPQWASETELAEAWELEDRAKALRNQAALLLAKREQLLQASLTHKADLAEAHSSLVNHYLSIHREAEHADRPEECASAALQIRNHLESLAPDHPTRVQASAYLDGTGALSIRTSPAGARVFLSRYEIQNRRSVAGEERLLGTTPSNRVPLEMGSYRLRIVADGCHEVIYPIDIRRQHHWDGVDPDGESVSIWLPPVEEIEEDECYVPPGFFVCGRDPGIPLKLPDGRIWVDGFTIKRHPVTNRQIIEWLDDLAANGSEADLEFAIPRPRSAQGDLGPSCFSSDENGKFGLVADEYGVVPQLDYPVVMISWPQMNAYARWLGEKTGKAWRLPEELEWEKAARGVDGRTYPWGEGFSSSWCCMAESKENKGIEVVTSRPDDRSVYGVMNMAGHVFDWTRTPYSPTPTLPEDNRCRISPDGGEPSQAYTFKGGSWHSIPIFSHCAIRIGFPGITQWPMAGFRLARSLHGDD